MCIVNFLPEAHHAVLPPGIYIPKLPPLETPPASSSSPPPAVESIPPTSPLSPNAMSESTDDGDFDPVESAIAAMDQYLKIVHENEDPLSNFEDSVSSPYNVDHEDALSPISKNLFAKLKPKLKKGSIDKTKKVIKVVLYNLANINDFVQVKESFKDDARKSMLTSTTVREQLTISRANKAGIVEYNGHRLASHQYGVLLTCSHCKKKIDILDKCRICQECKLIFHPKCYKSSTASCTGVPTATPSSQPKAFFGTKIQDLVASESTPSNIPRNLDRMMLELEAKGLFTLGLYRVNANQNQIKSMKSKLMINNPDISLEGVLPQTMAAMIKMFFRELPEPILTFSLYDDLMRSSKLEPEQRTKAMLDLVHKLPSVNFSVFERLIYHLALIAQQEASNKMNASSLAVIFAPNILRPQKEPCAMQQLEEVKHRTVIVQTIIEAKMKQMKQIEDEMSDGMNEESQNNENLYSQEHAEQVIRLAQMPSGEEVVASSNPPSYSSSTGAAANPNTSATISQGISALSHPTKNRPRAEKRAPSRRNSADISSFTSSSANKSIADGVRKKGLRGSKNQKTYHSPYNNNHM